MKSMEFEQEFPSFFIEKFKKRPFHTFNNNSSLKIFNPNDAINELNKNHKKDKDFEILKGIFIKLLNDNKVDNFDDLCPKILEIFHVSHGRKLLNSILEKISTNIILQKQESFDQISIIINYCLNAYLLEKDTDNILLFNILIISRFIIYKSSEGKKIALFKKIKEHQIWQEQERWVPILDDLLKVKIPLFKIANENIKKNNQDALSKRKLSNRGSKLLNSITSIFSKNRQEEEEFELSKKNFVYDTLANFSYILSLTHLSKEQCFFILFQIGTKYSLISQKITDLFLEYSSNHQISDKDSPIKIKKHSNKNEGVNVIINNCILFVSQKSTLLSLLLLSKKIKHNFTIKIYKHLLFRINNPIKLEDKLKIWDIIIDINSINIGNYEILKQTSESNKSQIVTYDVILMDVSRSFNNNKEIDHSSMINILRSYAYFDKSIEYCQGMNFIVCYLLFLYKDEEKVFKFLHVMMHKYFMKNVFKQGMTLLIKSFYIFDKLISTYIPDLFEELKSEGLQSSFFTSSWFVTIFSSSLHFTKKLEPPILLTVIWDIFLIYGWKGLYLVSLFILLELKSKIIGQKFDIVILYLSEALKGDLIKSETVMNKMKQFILKYPLSKRVLTDLEKEYDLLQNEYNRILSNTTLK